MTTEPFAPIPIVTDEQPRRRWWVVPVVSALAVLLVGVGVATVTWTLVSRRVAPNSASSSPSTARIIAPPPVVAQPRPTWAPPAPRDFTLTVKILKKACFGSAGCNITYHVDLAYSGPPVEPGTTWDVTYEVKGGEDVQINTLELTFDETGLHGSYLADREELIGTRSSSSKLTAVVTAVSAH